MQKNTERASASEVKNLSLPPVDNKLFSDRRGGSGSLINSTLMPNYTINKMNLSKVYHKKYGIDKNDLQVTERSYMGNDLQLSNKTKHKFKSLS